MRKFIEINGRLLEVSGFAEINGQQIPVVKATAMEKVYPDGRKDVTVQVPCFALSGSRLKTNQEHN